MAVNQVIETAVGGMNLTQTVEGRERYPIRIRYQRDLRERIDDLSRLPVVTESGEVVPLEVLARMKTTWGPGMISSEDARLVAHIAFAPSGMAGDLETIEAVESQLRQDQANGTLKLPAGYCHLHGATICQAANADGGGYSQRHGGSGPSPHPPLFDDSVHNLRRTAPRHARNGTRLRRGASDGPASLLRHVRGIGVPLRGAGPVLRLHGIETEPRFA